jgi:hypothetical protein
MKEYLEDPSAHWQELMIPIQIGVNHWARSNQHRSVQLELGFQKVVWSNIGDLLRAAPHTFCTVTRSSVVPPISTVFDYGLILMYLTSLRRSLPAANYIGRLREGLPLGKEYIWEGKLSVHTVNMR